MESLSNLRKKEIKREVASVYNINGGARSHSVTQDAAGCTVTTSDIYQDANCNGVWDVDESGSSCTEISC
ncbi:hypothetical protein [Ascidiimonas aurantiaca]|uniref:hypothetical protein n=1 Tax=Ascidiimonas aurantiaca TaxID=1685432 RepID=UPI0030ED7AFF